MSVSDSTPAVRAVVKVAPTMGHEKPGFRATCFTGTCTWESPVHVVKTAAAEEAGWHRQDHKSGRIDSAGKRVTP